MSVYSGGFSGRNPTRLRTSWGSTTTSKPPTSLFPAVHFVRDRLLNRAQDRSMHRHGGCKYRSHMSQLRLAALVTLLAAGCYSEAAPQSTLPEPQYVAGPPGGAVDPGYGYAYATDGSGANVGPGIAATDPADPADDDDRDDDTDPAANGGFDPARDPSIGAPGGAAP